MDELKNQIIKALDFFPHIHFDKKHPWHRNIVCLYCSVVEYSDSLFSQFKIAKNVAIPLLVRSLLEAYVDLKNLCEDRKYGYNLQAAKISEWLRVAKEAGGLDNPYLEGLAKHEKFDEQVSEWERELAELEKLGYRKLSKFDSFKLAGKVHEYKSIYNILCSYSHNNERALIDRHIEISENDSDFNIVMFKEFKVEDQLHYIVLASKVLSDAGALVHKYLKTGHEGIFYVT